MKKFLATMMIAVTTMSMLTEAMARPVGGGRSIGRQSSAVTRQQAAPAPVQRPAAAPAAAAAATPAAAAMAPKPASRWKGMLGGALLGLGLGAMLSHFGLGGALASMISSILMIALLALAVLFIYRMFRRKDTPADAGLKYATPMPSGHTPDIGSGIPPGAQPAAFEPLQPSASSLNYAPAAPAAAAVAPAAPWGVPADFDSVAFLRHAKSSFIRMQAAWDKADTDDLREFTTPEVYAELKMQIQERGATVDFTDVVTIDGELLGIETIGNEYLVSVKFTGMIKPAHNAAAEPFAEVWNMSKPVSGSSGWVLAGIQQLS